MKIFVQSGVMLRPPTYFGRNGVIIIVKIVFD